MEHKEVTSKFEIGVGGFFKLEAFKSDADGNEIPGSRRELTPWFHNIVLNTGLDSMGTSGTYLNACQVGTSSTTPVATQTALGGFLVGTATKAFDTNGVLATTPYYGWRRITYRFAIGVATGNIAEVGIGTLATGGVLTSRALTVDGGGLPTVVTVLADEQLDVVYEFRLYPPLADNVHVVNFSGTNYTVTARAANVGTAIWGSTIGNTTPGIPTGASGSVRLYNGAIGAITTEPTGTTSDGGTSTYTTNNAYVNGSYKRTATTAFGLTLGNLAGGVTAARISISNFGTYQFGFSPAFAKDNTKILTMVWEYSWTRH